MPKIRWLTGAVAVALLTPFAAAQTPEKNAAEDAENVDWLLTKWEKSTAGLKSVSATVSRTTAKKIFQTVDREEGVLKLLRSTVPNRGFLASLKLSKAGAPQDFFQALWTDKEFFLWNADAKVILAMDRAAPDTEPAKTRKKSFLESITFSWRDVPFGPAYFDMNAAKAGQRYEITRLTSDSHYHYVVLVPRNVEAEFIKEVRVALTRSTCLPRQIWIRQANDDEVTWDFPRITVDAGVGPLDFAAPNPPDGWKLERVGK